MRARAGIAILYFCAWSFVMCAEPALQAQAPTAASPQVGTSGQDASNELFVAVGKSVLVDIALPIGRIAVGSSDIAEATAVSPTEVLVNGKASGETTLIVWETGGGRQFFNVTVRATSTAATETMDGLRRELRTELPGQTVTITAENNLIFLRGTVKDLNSSARAVQIASTAGKVVNLLYVDVPAPDPQILLKVRFASVDRSLEKQLGINIFSTGAANTIGTVTTGQFSPPGVSLPSAGTPAAGTVSNALNLFIFRPDLNLGATLEALQTSGLVEVLAEPNVLAENGKEASFLAGGEYPYPIVQGVSGTSQGAVTIQFKEYGIRLNFIPTITPRNTIRLQVAPEVSSLDFSNGVVISGFSIPGIDVRNVKTEVELSDGQSFAIGGLLDNRENETLSKIPFIGDVPILGKFFQSIQRTKSNTELIVIVTPVIVQPIPTGAPLPALKYPQKFLPPNSGIAMANPGGTEATPPAAPATMPVEQLIQSMRPEQQLVVDPGSSAYGGSQMPASSAGASSTGASSAPQ